MTEEVSTVYARRVGERLRSVRTQQGLSLQGVEAASNQEFKASVLGAYERGERAISVPRLQRLAKFYNVPVDQLLPRDVNPEPDWGRSPPQPAASLSDSKVTIDLTKLDDAPVPVTERELLQRYLSRIQVERQDFNGRVLTIRTEDLRAIACMFDTDSDRVRAMLKELGLRL
jgi:transcriptional regulator with XRE-family HTH domain